MFRHRALRDVRRHSADANAVAGAVWLVAVCLLAVLRRPQPDKERMHMRTGSADANQSCRSAGSGTSLVVPFCAAELV